MRPQARLVWVQRELPARGVAAGRRRLGSTCPDASAASIRARPPTAAPWIRRRGQMLGPNSALAIGTLIPEYRLDHQQRVSGGHGSGAETFYDYPSHRRHASRRCGVRMWRGTSAFVACAAAPAVLRPRAGQHASTARSTIRPFTRNVTVRYGELQNMASTGLRDRRRRRHLTVWQIDKQAVRFDAVEWRRPDDAAVLDRARRRVHRPALASTRNAGVNLNSLDLGVALPAVDAESCAGDVCRPSTDPATSYAVDESRSGPLLRWGWQRINQQQPIGWRTYHSVQHGREPAVPQRVAVWLQRHHPALS